MSKNVRKTWFGDAVAAAFAAALLVLFFAPIAVADEPGWEMELDLRANNLTLGTYDVRAENEVDFLEAITGTGGYVGKQPGFSVEKVIRSLDGAVDGTIRFWVATRHYNRAAMEIAQEERNAAVAPFLSQLPEIHHTEIAEHRVANWGLERHEPVSFTSAQPMAAEPQVFEEYGTTLAFFKYGYTGQIGWVQEHEADRNPQAAKAAVLSYDGLSGMSMTRTDSGRTVTYAEFFATPEGAKQLTKTAGGVSGLGTVILNYRER